MKSIKIINYLVLILCSANFAGDYKMKVDALVSPKIIPKIITVGDKTADINGFTTNAIQTAIDALEKFDGGTVQLTPGNFDIDAPIELASDMTLLGSGEKTALRKIDGVKSPLVVDADYGELKLQVSNAKDFKPGMGVQIYDENQKNGWAVTTAKITDIVNNTIYIDTYLVRDYRADNGGVVSNACSIIQAVETENVKIANLVVDGNREANEYLNGCRGGAVYLHKVKNAFVENVVVKDFDGDGISWQITEDVTVKNCEVSGCTKSGLHPGTGSPNSIVVSNKSHHNDQDGMFICWRVQHGLIKNNEFFDNGRFGLCTGHKDTDVRFEDNHIHDNGDDGVHFRGERESNAPHRNYFINNIVENNNGYGFGFNSPAKDVVLEKNIIRDTGKGVQKAAIFYFKNGLPVELKNNTISGHTQGEVLSEEKQ
jgi:hypothetical protein